MKKLGFCGLLAGMSASVFAQSSVTLYGVADTAVAYTHAGQSTIKQISGMGSTSRIGITGSEDLGGGLTVEFRMESGMQLDTGAAGGTTAQSEQSLFNRESNIAIGSSQFGKIKLGRQYPAQIPVPVDPFQAVSGFSPFASIVASNQDLGKGATIGDSRISNAISYFTPEYKGFSGQALYAPRELNTAGYPRAADYGVEAHYESGPLLYLGGQWNVINTDPTSSIPSVKNIWSGVAAQYQIGSSVISYLYNNVAPSAAASRVAQSHQLGWLYTPNARDTYKLALIYRNVAGDHTLNSFTIGAGYDYNLSKSSSLYTRIGYVANHAKSVSSLSGTVLARAGEDVSVIAVGMRQRF